MSNTLGPVVLLFRGEQVEQVRAQAGAVQHGGDMPLAAAVPVAAAAVGEDHDPWRVLLPYDRATPRGSWSRRGRRQAGIRARCAGRALRQGPTALLADLSAVLPGG